MSHMVGAARPDEPSLAVIVRPLPLLLAGIPSVRHPLADLPHLLARVADGQVVDIHHALGIGLLLGPLLLGEGDDPARAQDVRHRQVLRRVVPPVVVLREGERGPHHLGCLFLVAVGISQRLTQHRLHILRWLAVIHPVVRPEFLVDAVSLLFEESQSVRKIGGTFLFHRR